MQTSSQIQQLESCIGSVFQLLFSISNFQSNLALFPLSDRIIGQNIFMQLTHSTLSNNYNIMRGLLKNTYLK